MVEITNVNIRLNKEKILRRLGYNEKNKLDKRVESIIDKQIQEGYSLIDPYVVYKDLGIEYVKEDEIRLKNAFFIKCKALANILKKADKATLIAVTIGEGLEKPSGDLTADSIRDAIGSEAVEELAIAVNELITKRAKSAGYKTLFRFGVGYGGWDIKDQKKILELLKPKDIELGTRYIMHPRKSITALIGWEKE